MPVAPLAAALGAVGFSVWGSVSVAATLSGVLLTAGSTILSTGVSLIGRAIFGGDRPTSPGAPDAGARQTIRQSTPPQRIVYGLAEIAGAVSYIGKDPPYLYAQYLVAAGRNEIDGVRINGRIARFNANGGAVDSHFSRAGVSLMKYSARLGEPDQAADALLAAGFPDLPASFRQRGITVVTLRADYGADRDQHEEVWGTGGFEPTFIVRGRRVYDPRDAAQDPDDDATWAWSDNWALVLADWVASPFGGRKRRSQVDWAAVAAEAALCDQPVGMAEGTSQRRYTVNTHFQTTDDPFQVLNGILNCGGQGRALWTGGLFRPLADVPRKAVRTLTEADLADAFSFRNENPRRDAPNVIRANFVYADRQYQAATTPPLRRTDLIAIDGEEIETTIDLYGVSDPERAQRLQKIALERGRLGRRLELTLWLDNLDLEAGDDVAVQFANFAFADGTYTIETVRLNDRLDIMSLGLVEAAPASVHAWDPATEVQSTDLITFANA